MKIKNVLLVYPEFDTSFWSFKYTLKYVGKKSSMPPLGLLTLAGMFPKEYNLRLVDMNVRELTNQDLQWADLVCTSTMIVQRRSLVRVIAHARGMGKPICAGGPHPTSYWEEIEGVDYFLLGEVEETLSSFLEDLEQGIAQHIYTPKERPAITKTPMPRYDLINMRDYGSMLLQFSRGCPFDCEFCDITKLYGRIPRTKTNEQMLAEFQLLYNLGYRGSLFLVDDNFIGNRRDALRLLIPKKQDEKGLVEWQRERGYPFDLYTEASMNLVDHEELMDAMIAAGFTSVFVGIETPTPEALIVTKKKQNVDKADPEYPLHAIHTLQRKGMEVMGGFILGLDGDTENMFDLHIEFIKQAAIPIAMEGVLTVLKGTDLYFRMEREGRLRGDTTGTSIGTHLNFVPQIPEETLIAGYKRVLNAIYDASLENYFERCWTLFQRLSYADNPKTTLTPMSISECMRFLLATSRQLVSRQGPAYLQFLTRVITQKPSMIRKALALGAKGYHLRKITEQITAVDNFKQYLARISEHLREEFAKRAKDGNVRVRAYAAHIVSHVQREYARIHEDFRYNAEGARTAFLNFLEDSLKEYEPIT
ncbi:MAG: DUF4070 domain-containing protein [Patescibacteria group bacterium]